MHAVEVEIRVAELVRDAGVHRHQIPVGRKVVRKLDAEHFARLHAHRRARDRPLKSPHVEAGASHILVGVVAIERGLQNAVGRAANLRLDQRLIHRRDDLVGHQPQRA